MTHDSGLSSTGLICCYAMSHRYVDIKSLVIHPSFAWQRGLLTFILSLALQLALVMLSSCGFSTTLWFRAFAMGSPLQVESAFVNTLSIGTKTPSEPYSKILRDVVTLWVECGPRYTLDRNEGLSWLFFQVPSEWGHPFRVEFLATRSRLKEFLGLSLWRHIAVPPP